MNKAYVICTGVVLPGMPRVGGKGVLSPGPQGSEAPFRYQNGYYLSAM